MDQRTLDHRPKLLVSVRNLAEAQAALAGGCDLLDVKDPSRGSLGMADVDEMRRIIDGVKTDCIDPPGIPLSAALGETADWEGSESIPELPAGLSYVKLGTASLGGRSDWPRVWAAVRKRFDSTGDSALRWIAVAYADWRQAAAPPPEDVFEAAVSTECAGLLFDTHFKDNGTLFTRLSSTFLGSMIRRIRDAGLLSAIAGSLSMADMPQAVRLSPDIIAVRTAACLNARRTAAVSSSAVRRLRAVLREGLPPRGIDTVPA